MLSENGLNLLAEFKRVGFFPIVSMYDEQYVMQLVAQLCHFSINLIEVTVRSPEAFKCIEAIRKKHPEMIIGAGSILSEAAFDKAHNAGAHFFVSPCFHKSLASYAQKKGYMYIPAFLTPSELFEILTMGFTIVKIFPARFFGTSYLESVAKPFVQFDFHYVPTGGITAENFKEFLLVKNVAACGISAFLEGDDVTNFDEQKLYENLKQLCAIRDSARS